MRTELVQGLEYLINPYPLSIFLQVTEHQHISSA